MSTQDTLAPKAAIHIDGKRRPLLVTDEFETLLDRYDRTDRVVTKTTRGEDIAISTISIVSIVRYVERVKPEPETPQFPLNAFLYRDFASNKLLVAQDAEEALNGEDLETVQQVVILFNSDEVDEDTFEAWMKLPIAEVRALFAP